MCKCAFASVLIAFSGAWLLFISFNDDSHVGQLLSAVDFLVSAALSLARGARLLLPPPFTNFLFLVLDGAAGSVDQDGRHVRAFLLGRAFVGRAVLRGAVERVCAGGGEAVGHLLGGGGGVVVIVVVLLAHPEGLDLRVEDLLQPLALLLKLLLVALQPLHGQMDGWMDG